MVDAVVTIVANDMVESRIDVFSDDDDDWDLKGAVGVDSVECVGVKRRLETLQESCQKKCWQVRNTVAEAGALVAELVQRFIESGVQSEDTTALEQCRWRDWDPVADGKS